MHKYLASAFQLTSAAGLAFALSACSASPRLSAAGASQANDQLAVYRVEAHKVSDGVMVSGMVRRPAGQFGALTGAIRVTGTDAATQKVVSSDVRWSPMAQRAPQTASFSTVLRTDHPEQLSGISARYVTSVN
jgi:hypothetical protein